MGWEHNGRRTFIESIFEYEPPQDRDGAKSVERDYDGIDRSEGAVSTSVEEVDFYSVSCEGLTHISQGDDIPVNRLELEINNDGVVRTFRAINTDTGGFQEFYFDEHGNPSKQAFQKEREGYHIQEKKYFWFGSAFDNLSFIDGAVEGCLRDSCDEWDKDKRGVEIAIAHLKFYRNRPPSEASSYRGHVISGDRF